MIRDRVVVGIKDNIIWKKFLVESKFMLNKCIDICCVSEIIFK